MLIAVGGPAQPLLVPESAARDASALLSSALLCSAARDAPALLHRTPLLCFCITLFCSHWRQHSGSNSGGQNTDRGGRLVNQQSVPSANSQQIPTILSTFLSRPSLCIQHFLFFFSGECNGRNLNFAMPLLRGKDESDAAVAAVGSCHHSSARLRAEADGAAPWLHGGGSQRDDPGPGSSRVRLPLPVHLLPIPAASGYKCVRLWPSSSEGAVHSSWSSLPFPC